MLKVQMKQLGESTDFTAIISIELINERVCGVLGFWGFGVLEVGVILLES